MRPLRRRDDAVLIICAVVLILFALFQWFLKPFQASKEDIAYQQRVAQVKLSKSRAIAAKAQALSQEYAQFKEILGVSTSQGKEVSLIMSRMENAANVSKVHIVNMQPLQVVDKGAYSIFSVEISFDGPWAAITKFFYAAQDNTNLFKIEELNLEKYSDSTEALRGRAVLSRIRLNNS